MEALKLKKLYKKGCYINWFLHPLRNNPRYRYALYHGFIAWVGINNWNRVAPEIKNSWKSAANSFDKLLGLLKVYSTYNSAKDLLTTVAENQKDITVAENQKDIKEDLKKCIDIMNILNRYIEYSKPSVAEYKFLKDLVCACVSNEIEEKKVIMAYLEEKIEDRANCTSTPEWQNRQKSRIKIPPTTKKCKKSF